MLYLAFIYTSTGFDGLRSKNPEQAELASGCPDDLAEEKSNTFSQIYLRLNKQNLKKKHE